MPQNMTHVMTPGKRPGTWVVYSITPVDAEDTDTDNENDNEKKEDENNGSRSSSKRLCRLHAHSDVSIV
jgi:hypothetical protein